MVARADTQRRGQAGGLLGRRTGQFRRLATEVDAYATELAKPFEAPFKQACSGA